MTTSNNIEGRKIVEYKEIVFGEVVLGINFIKDIGASLNDIFGGRSIDYEEEISRARDEALVEMRSRAVEIGADAIINVKMDYETMGSTSMLMISCSGTAVILD